MMAKAPRSVCRLITRWLYAVNVPVRAVVPGQETAAGEGGGGR